LHLDGTKGFLRQDQYAIALALIVDGDVQLGILACPALDKNGGLLFYAVRGQGSYSQPIQAFQTSTPTRLRTITSNHIEQYRLVESVESNHGDQNRQNRIAQSIGITHPSIRMDSQVKYGLVANGQAVLYLRLPNPSRMDYRENIWDHAAGAIVVEEAGGRVTDMNGKPLNFADNEKMLDNHGVVVSNGAIHQQVLDVLKV
jgi:3'(2'), 5'-bisphosphate nucleotidase